jgi:hypothetical protein
MDNKEYLSKAEFYQYMGDFRQELEKRLTRLESKIANGKSNNPGNREKLIYILIGAVLVLAGATAGTKLFGGLF